MALRREIPSLEDSGVPHGGVRLLIPSLYILPAATKSPHIEATTYFNEGTRPLHSAPGNFTRSQQVIEYGEDLLLDILLVEVARVPASNENLQAFAEG